jgi:Flp pilus assembly protein TadD
LAQNRVGDLAGALKSIETAGQLGGGGESRIWLLLAMTHWRLGHRQEARDWYEKAADWVSNRHPFEQDNYSLLAEVESLIKGNPHED